MSFTENKPKCAVFDLDGTLINTLTDLRSAGTYVMNKHGFKADYTEDDYKKFVGNGIKKLVDRLFGETLDEDALDGYTKEFIEYYNLHSLDNTHPYSGIPVQVEKLKNAGIKTCVVTNKAEPSAVIILETLFGRNAFDLIVGQRDNLPVKPDPAGVFEALRTLGVTAGEALYFGDSNVDMLTAKNAGIRAVGVTWGFRSYEELASFSPYRIISSPEEISEMFK